MPRQNIGGIDISYEIIGDGPQTLAITGGGRLSKDEEGIRELASRLAEGGLKVLIWDRPNCGESDIAFLGDNESVMNADALTQLLREIDFGPTILVGGSAGSRFSMFAAVRSSEQVAGMFLFWLSGGPIGLALLASYYCGEHALAAINGGMEAVAALPAWKESIARNPGNRDRLLAYDRYDFIATMQRYAKGYFPAEASPIPGLLPEDYRKMTMPVTILRSGKADVWHTRDVSEETHRLIGGSHIAESPWPDNEFNDRMAASMTGGGIFARWPMLAPQILEFAKCIRR